MQKKKWRGVFIFFSVFLFSCSLNNPTSSISNPSFVTSEFKAQLQLNQSSLFLEVGNSFQFVATFLDKEVTDGKWTSMDETIATIENGNVQALKEGTTKITCFYEDQEASCKVTVLKEKDEEQKSGEVHMYAMNDFHGAIQANGREIGFLKNATFFKEKGREENTLILNSGDMFQGSIYSNSNYGEFLAKAMNNIGFDGFTLGNHEFDWGQEYIKKNRNLEDEMTKYQTPYLGANIYYYDIEKGKTLQHADDLVDSYVIRDLENGLRIGIIGVIGENQITSITSNYVDNLSFEIPTGIIKQLSDELRTQQKCDAIILDAHASFSQIDESVTSTSPISHKKYIDAAFLAHSHQYEEYIVNNVPFVQGSSNGKSYSEIHLKLTNGTVENVEYSSHQNGNLETAKIQNYDTELQDLYTQYIEKAEEKASEVLGNIDGDLYSSCNSSPSLPKLVVKAMGEEAIKQGYKIDFALCNNARATLYRGVISYETLYKSLPFDNEIYVLRVRGDSIIRQSRYNSIYCATNKKISENEYYLIAVIDYLAFHRNSYRQYDYFPHQTYVGKLTKEGYSIYNYRDLVADYIRIQKNIQVNDFTENQSCFVLNL